MRGSEFFLVTTPRGRSTASPTHGHGLVFRVGHSATSTQATAADIPENCRGRYWRLLAIGANVQWCFLSDEDGVGGVDTAPTLVYGQLTATGTGNAAAAGTLIDGVERHVLCPRDAKRVVFVSASAATGWFEAEVSGGKFQVGTNA